MTRYPAFLISQISMKCVLSSWRRGDKRLEEARRPIGFIHFCLLSADRGGPSLSSLHSFSTSSQLLFFASSSLSLSSLSSFLVHSSSIFLFLFPSFTSPLLFFSFLYFSSHLSSFSFSSSTSFYLSLVSFSFDFLSFFSSSLSCPRLTCLLFFSLLVSLFFFRTYNIKQGQI